MNKQKNGKLGRKLNSRDRRKKLKVWAKKVEQIVAEQVKAPRLPDTDFGRDLPAERQALIEALPPTPAFYFRDVYNSCRSNRERVEIIDNYVNGHLGGVNPILPYTQDGPDWVGAMLEMRP